MNYPLKFLKQDGLSFFPETVAEAVMVNHTTGVKRLDEVLKYKIEEVVTPVGSGLSSYRLNGGLVITHSNSIDPSVDELKPKIIKYDNRGHIVEASDFGKIKITVNSHPHVEYDGSASAFVHFGEDFTDDNGYILIRWNNLT